MCLIINIQSFHDKEILQIFYRSLQLVCKLKNHHNDFSNVPQIQLWENSFGGFVWRRKSLSVLASVNAGKRLIICLVKDSDEQKFLSLGELS